MTWVSVATLVVTACYLLYRFPPSTWTPESGPEPFPKPPSAEPTSESPRAAATEDATTNIASSPVAEEDEGGAEESQSTPKASASNAPALEIPTLHLKSEATTELQADTAPLQNGSARPAAANLTPTPPISTTKTPPATLMPPPSLPRQQPQTAPGGSSSSLMPPPAPPRLRPLPTMNQQSPQQQSSSLLTPPRAYPPRPSSNSLAPPPSAAASARARPGASSSGGLAPPTQLRAPPQKAASSKRPVLEPGFSPLDWAALTSNPNNNLRGANLPPTLIRVTPSMLKKQNGRKGTDAWTSFQGKVYNISPYLPFHPGGKGELLRGAGKDSGKLFFEIHPWVNWDAIMGECLVGILVSEHEATEENTLDAMD